MDDALIGVERKEYDTKWRYIKSDDEYKQIIREKTMGVLLIKRTNNKYNILLTIIRDQHSFNFDAYPKKIHNVYELLENHSSGTQQNHQNCHHDGSRRYGGR